MPRAPRRDDQSAPPSRGLTFRGPDRADAAPLSSGVSGRMSRTGRRDTKPELELRRLLHGRGLRFRVDRAVLTDRTRRADIVFGPARVVVVADGCFWHGCPDHATWPAHNAAFWREKIETNRARDPDTDRRPAGAGWTVVRVWEHDDPVTAADLVERLVRERRP